MTGLRPARSAILNMRSRFCVSSFTNHFQYDWSVPKSCRSCFIVSAMAIWKTETKMLSILHNYGNFEYQCFTPVLWLSWQLNSRLISIVVKECLMSLSTYYSFTIYTINTIIFIYQIYNNFYNLKLISSIILTWMGVGHANIIPWWTDIAAEIRYSGPIAQPVCKKSGE